MSYCTLMMCVAHRQEGYFNLQSRTWVHASGWPCEAMADVPAPARWEDY
jgi:hypothetical protein